MENREEQLQQGKEQADKWFKQNRIELLIKQWRERREKRKQSSNDIDSNFSN